MADLTTGLYTNTADYRLPATTTGANANTAVGQLLLDRGMPDLFKNYELIRWGVDAVQPDGTGLKIYAPTFDDISKIHTAKIAAKTEHAPSDSDEMTFGNHSGDLEYFQQPINISKVFGATATLKEYAQRAANYLMVGCAMTQEDLAWRHILYSDPAGATTYNDPTANEIGYMAPDGSTTAFGSLTASQVPSIKGMSKSRKYLKKASNPGFSEAGGKFVALVGPEWVDQMITNVLATTPTFEESSMGMQSAFTDNRVGTLSGFQIIETNNVHEFAGGVGHPSGSSTPGEMCLLFAPGAFYVSSHSSLQPMINVVPFNTPSKSDPSGQIMIVAIDYMAGAFAGRLNESMVLMPVINV